MLRQLIVMIIVVGAMFSVATMILLVLGALALITEVSPLLSAACVMVLLIVFVSYVIREPGHR
jgi:hypothetical protein